MGQGSYRNGSATALNDFGQVTGELFTPTGTHAFITGPNGVGIRDLGTFYGADATFGTSINNAGQVVGTAIYSDIFTSKAFITGPDGVDPKTLNAAAVWTGDPWIGDFDYPAAINDTGQVAGSTGGKYFADRAFITGPNGKGITNIGNLGGTPPPGDGALAEPDQPRAHVSGINETGQVVGYSDAAGESDTAEGNYHAFITGPDGVGMRDLGTLGGAESYAFDINDGGQVVGWSDIAGGRHAFITGPDGMEMRDLGTLGGDWSMAYAVNDAGQVVGWSDIAGGRHAFITGPNGEDMMDLNSLVDLPQEVILTRAVDINNNGQVIAAAIIPEPNTYALMLAGLGLIGFVVHRRKSEARI